MNNGLLLAIALILSNLLAPSLAKLVQFHYSAAQREAKKHRRKTDRKDGSRPLAEMALMCLPLVLALLFDIYVVGYQTSQSGSLSRSDLWINDLALLMACLQVLAMAGLAGLNVLRSRDRAGAASLTALGDQLGATNDTIRSNFAPIAAGLAKLTHELAALQRTFEAGEKAVLTTLAEQSAAIEGLREVTAANQRPKALSTHAEETLPERKPDLRGRHDAAG